MTRTPDDAFTDGVRTDATRVVEDEGESVIPENHGLFIARR